MGAARRKGWAGPHPAASEAAGPEVLPGLDDFLVNAQVAGFDFGGGSGPEFHWRHQGAEAWRPMQDPMGADGVYRRLDDDLAGPFLRDDFDFSETTAPGGRNRPSGGQAATIRSTSPTRSRRWTGLDRTLACGLAWAADRATAAKPVMNMMRMPG
jgi:hypothetical protein